ncbi:MAG: HAD-IC family P-type ATPase [Caldilineaceae bacterium]|nr:HAD-IC family P-type ATPase [Caldilineaceae bacterium]
MDVYTGLSENEAQQRRAAGLGNDVAHKSGRSYVDIIRANLFTFFNNILFAIGIALIAMGRINDAITSVGIGLVNALISTLQEMRAKRQLDQISLLTKPIVTVVRDGREREIDPNELVQGDLLRVNAGDQIVVDGVLVGDGMLEMDEALLTGEPNLIRKQAGDQLLSGSFCVTGAGSMQAEKVGAQSFANQLAMTARELRISHTPLQRKIDLLVKIVMLLVAVFSILIFAASLLEGLSSIRLIQIAAVLTGQVPYGLFLMVVVAYALGAAKVAHSGALVQQTNAVEWLSNVDVLCTDKTGTLTANRLRFNAIHPLDGADGDEVRRALGDFVRSASTSNQTSDAILAATDGEVRLVSDEVPFASARKWSGVAFNQTARRGLYLLGAVEMLTPYLPEASRVDDGELRRQMHCWSEQGLRVLLFAHAPDVVNFHNMAGELEVPALTPLALISLRDELRPQVRETVAEFARLGIDLKVISGDSPFTVAALAKQAGLPDGIQLVSGPELAEMSTAAFEEAVTDATIFGRVSPQQKEQIVEALQQRGRHVAMIGDGVNDVLSLKKASIGIAMQSGSNATRNVADMILLDDSFAALRPAFHEGQRIVAGMSNILYLFLARSLTTMLVIIGVMTVGLPFPFDPAQVALTTFTVGIPAFFLTLWARPRKVEPDILLSLARFAIPVALLTMLMGVGLYLNNFQRASTAPVDVENAADHRGIPDKLVESYSAYTGVDPTSPEFGTAFGTIAAQGALSIFISHTAFLLILFLEPPFRFFTGWRTHVSKDKRPALLALALLLMFQIFYFVPTIGGYFGLLEKPPTVYLRILALVVVWMFAMRTIWRHHLFDRFLGLDFQPK